jgi:hypothetical protein
VICIDLHRQLYIKLPDEQDHDRTKLLSYEIGLKVKTIKENRNCKKWKLQKKEKKSYSLNISDKQTMNTIQHIQLIKSLKHDVICFKFGYCDSFRYLNVNIPE